MEKAHALLSASSSHRWIKCPPSARIAAEFPESTSEAAEEGTAAHKEAEEFFLHWKLPSDPFVKGYVEFIQRLVIGYKAKLLIEGQADYSHIAPRGFGTADCTIYTSDLLHIVDLKYGQSVKVSAEENTQLILYASGMIRKLKIIPESIRMTIYQPRMDNISTWEISLEELMFYVDQIRPRAHLAWKGQGELSAGDHCTFCPARNFCPEFKKYFEETYLATF